MKNLRSILFVLAAILMIPAAKAQQSSVKADVPFDFVIGNRAYPAGEYILKSPSDSNGVIRLENVHQVSTDFIPSNPCEKGKPSTETKLVFHRMGERYFLYQVWIAGNLTGREFPKGRIEIELAQNHESPDLVIVAAVLTR